MMKKPAENGGCLRTALRILTRRDHGREELSRKLAERGYSADHISAVAEKCTRLDYLNDERFAVGYASELQRKGYGRRRIEQMLVSKGLPREIVDASLQTCCQEKAQMHGCRQAMIKKLKGMGRFEINAETRARLYRFLFNRGFAAGIIKLVMAERSAQRD